MERTSSSFSSSSNSSSSSMLSSSFLTSSMLSRTSSSSSSAVGDYIGAESCFDVVDEENNDVVGSTPEPLNPYRYGGRRREEREARAAAAREFPPPIPLLAQTENLLPHMPWVLKRVVTNDGRLILREEKVRHHEYFRADRSNGRLTLHLVPLDDDVFELPQEPSHDDDDDHECDGDDVDDHHEVDDLADNVDKSVIITARDDVVHSYDDDKCNVHGGSEDECRKIILAAEETVGESGGMVGGGGGSPRGKCMKSCFVGMRVQEIRPVLS